MAQDRTSRKSRGTRGFAHAGGILAQRVRAAGSARGFSEARILTNWEEIVGPALARFTRPCKVSYAKQGFGATLTVYAEGARAPELQMQLPMIRERVNACYGYNAIARVRITQTDRSSAAGMAEQAPAFRHDVPPPEPDAKKLTALGLDNVKDGGLRAALESLSKSVLTRKS